MYTTEELLLFENLTYLDDNPPFRTVIGSDNMTLKDFLDSFDLSIVDDDKDYASFITGKDWKNIFDTIYRHPRMLEAIILESHLDMAYGGGLGLSVVFLNKKDKEAVVAFRGTATNEWTDDFLGANQIDSLQQINCLEWYKMIYNKLNLEDYYINVIGHSKGGNKAKYITILNETVDKCTSFDGQGFSDKFIEHYKKEIIKRQNVIENHNIDYDFVNILMNDVGKKFFYYGYDYGRGGFAESHAPNTFFDFSEPGKCKMCINPNGQAKEMQVLDQFINSMIRSAYNDEDRSQNNMLVGTLVEKAFSIGAKEVSPEEFITILCDMVGENQNNTSYLLSYVIKYAKQNKQFLEALKSVMTYFKADSAVKTIDMLADLVNSKKLNAILSISNFLIVHVNKIVVKKIKSIAKKKYDIDLTDDQIRKVLQIISMIKETLKTLEINFDGSDLVIPESFDTIDEDKKIASNLNIVVLAGGLSNERNISLHTGYMVYNELKSHGHNVILLDSYMGYKESEIKIDDAFSTPETYSLVIDSIPDEIPDLWAVRKRRKDQSNTFFGPNVLEICKQSDLVFIALHGENGENGKVQAAFDLLGIDYTGSDYFSSALSSNKIVSKEVFIKNGIPVPKGYSIRKNEIINEPDRFNMSYPVIVKPNNGGIGLGISVASDSNAFIKAVNNALKWENEVIVEEYIVGREFAVGILDGKALPVLEVLPLNTKDMDIGLSLSGIKSKRCPANIDDELSTKLKDCALKASNVLGLTIYSKVDFILKNDGTFVCLECDSLPQLNPYSHLASMAKEDGISFGEFCDKIIDMSFNKSSRVEK